MHWVEEKGEETTPTPDTVFDLAFKITCKTLPVDHAWALYEALSPLLPWLEADPIAGIHPLHVAESAHGWQRPEEPDALLHLSRRTKLILRLPRERLEEAQTLSGTTVTVAGHAMTIGEASTQPLSRSISLFARRVVIEETEDEEAFIRRQIDAMYAMGVRPKKLLPGLAHTLQTPQGCICGRLLSLEGLSLEESFSLQINGLGPARHLGCGIFIPHKPLSNVRL